MFDLLSKPGGINGFVMLPGEPLLLASQSIRRSDGSGQIQGYLILGRYLSDTRLSNISHFLNVSLTLKPVDTMTSTVESKLLQSLLQSTQPLVTSFSP